MSINAIKIQRVIRPLDLGEYQEEYAGTVIDVWVNPPLNISQQVTERLQNWQKASLKRVLLEKPAEFQDKSEEKSTENNPEAPTAGQTVGSEEEIRLAKKAEQEAKLTYYDWFAQVWEDSSTTDVRDLVEKLENEEPGMLIFLRDRTLRMLSEYLHSRKKA